MGLVALPQVVAGISPRVEVALRFREAIDPESPPNAYLTEEGQVAAQPAADVEH